MHIRLEREKLTVRHMLALYCQARHGGGAGLCPECAGLYVYAGARIAKCPFGQRKPVCARCTVHCYEKNRRARMQAVMRFSGPRMLLKHPWLSLLHMLDSLRYRAAKT